MKQKHININIATTYIWIGFVCAISFMEAWLKFLAPGIDTKLGLGIRQLVFAALNKVEIVCAIIISVMFLLKNYLPPTSFIIVVVILLLQSIWFLPYLDERADHIINGLQVPESNIHVLFVILEISKIVGLNIFGIKILKKKQYEHESN
ncbi:hypothetical protein [Flavivirga spongiicola]|uniref:DUF4149 domain-containing protein n=1 Tax=Flavivirga spongiicola TaxID=421621 RepID=A0ABU7XZ71_9FLAO|nr:hypothetical protein [Flavivirga sp. MEBiC05379]MDO5981082.1 hypothetical protein [Flavivirga sp. MEBiC05379]